MDTVFSDLGPKVEIPPFNKELSQLEELQTWFTDLTLRSAQATAEKIAASPFIKSKEGVQKLAEALMSIVPLRQSELGALVLLCKTLKTKEAPANSLGAFRTMLITLAIHPGDDFEFRNYIPYLIFLKKLAAEKVVMAWDCTNRIVSLPTDKPNSKFLALLFFIPEALKADDNTINKFVDAIDRLTVKDPFLIQLKEKREELFKDNYRMITELVTYGVEKTSIEYAIITDDVQLLKEFFSNDPTLTPNNTVPENIFLPYVHLQWEPTLAEYAAFFGSIACLDWLMEHNARRSLLTMYAVSGGHMNVVEKCEAERLIFHGCLIQAAYTRRFQLFLWLAKRTPKDKLLRELNLSLCRAVESLDIRLFRICLENHCSINFMDENNETPYFIAVKKNNRPLINYIQSYPGFRKNVPNVWGKVPNPLR